MAEAPGVRSGDYDWWYCLKHMRVERGPGCADKWRMGPYATEAEAANALNTAAQRNEGWDRAERREQAD